MSKIDPKIYRRVLAVREARRIDVATLFMRFFTYMATIGTISMLTLAGHSAFEATTVSSCLAVFTFFAAPRVSRQIDRRGQTKVVPLATAIAMLGYALLFATVQFDLPFFLCYPAVLLASFLPNAQALIRTRWTYLIESGKAGDDAPSLKTVFSYEGIIEDIAFMLGPSFAIALSAAVAPIAGMFCGAVLYCLGAVLLMSSKETEPIPSLGDGKAKGKRERGIFSRSATVRALFFTMIALGGFYGCFDTTLVDYCESIDFTVLASIVLMAESVGSIFVSAGFGMLKLTLPLRKQFIIFGCVFAIAYSLMCFVSSPTSLLVIAIIAGLTYAPFLITSNALCEHAVPNENLTEAMTWMNSGTTFGMVLGPISAGAVVDSFGPACGFNLCTGFALAIIVLLILFYRPLRKELER